MNNLWRNLLLVVSTLILCRADVQIHETIKQIGKISRPNIVDSYYLNLTLLDTINSTTGWQIRSASSKGYLYYFNDPLNINKTLLDLANPEDIDLSKFQGVDGVWVFPHKRFVSFPPETLYAIFSYTGSLMLNQIGINYYAYKGGEINVFNCGYCTQPIATLKSAGDMGWISQSVDFPSTTSSFRIEIRSETEGDFVFLDRITASSHQEDNSNTTPISEFSSVEPIPQHSTSSTESAVTTELPNKHDLVLDTNSNTVRWTISSVTSKGYLYYFQDPLHINKTLLNLVNPDDLDLNKLQGVEGVWVFPHKHFSSPPVETLYAVFTFSGFSQLYGSVGINYYAYKEGEINIFVANKMFATFKGENGSTGWSYHSVNFPTPTSNFRVEVHAEIEGSFVFLDKITACRRVDDETEPTTTISTEEPVSSSSNPGDYHKIMLDTNKITTGWDIASAPSRGYLYYFQDPVNINKTVLNLANADDVDLSKFQGVEGVWVFPHKRFLSPPPETLYAVFSYLGSPMFKNIRINYYAYKGGEINIFEYGNVTHPLVTFKGADSMGWISQSINLPSALNSFRLEIRGETEGDFVFLDRITASSRQEDDSKTTPISELSSVEPIPQPSTIISEVPSSTESTETTEAPNKPDMILDTSNNTSGWTIRSTPSNGYLYYFQDPLNINKNFLNLSNPDDVDLSKFQGVEGVWVFPHKHFVSEPPVTFYATFDYSGVQLFASVGINFYAYKGGEIHIFAQNRKVATFNGENGITGWNYHSVNLPNASAVFRVEIHADVEGSFVFLDKITAWRQVGNEPTEPPAPTTISSEEPISASSTSDPGEETEITQRTAATSGQSEVTANDPSSTSPISTIDVESTPPSTTPIVKTTTTPCKRTSSRPVLTLDTLSQSTIGWDFHSMTTKGYLYYSQDPLNINKTLLDLANADDFDLEKFEGVEGVWVFPHKRFLSPPPETLYSVFSYSGVQLYENIRVNYYAYKGGEIRIFGNNGTQTIATFKGTDDEVGWISRNVNFPSSLSSFRLEIRAEAKGDFVFLDRITAGARQEECSVTTPISDPSTIAHSSSPIDDTETTLPVDFTPSTSPKVVTDTESPTSETLQTETSADSSTTKETTESTGTQVPSSTDSTTKEVPDKSTTERNKETTEYDEGSTITVQESSSMETTTQAAQSTTQSSARKSKSTANEIVSLCVISYILACIRSVN